MAEKLEDFNLPHTVVTKIIKEKISDTNLSKEARIAFARAGSIFILYLSTHACYVAQNVNRKTLTGQDVLDALENLEFDALLKPLKQYLKEYKEAGNKIKSEKLKKAQEEAIENGDEEEEEEDEVEEEEVVDESENVE